MFNTDPFKTALKKLFFSVLILSLILMANKSGVFAAPAYNYTTGIWADTFSDNTGLGSKTNIDVNSGSVQLTTNDGLGGFVAPFYTSGTATSTVVDPIPNSQDYINPNSIAHYDNINIHATVPANTSATVQLLNYDGALSVYPAIVDDSIIPGNSVGISLTTGTTTVDISAFNSGPPVSFKKIFYLYLKTNLSTTDTDATPTIDRWEVTWTTSQGDLTATTLATSAWPMTRHDVQGTLRSQYNGPTYPTFKYFQQMTDVLSNTSSGSGSTAIIDALGQYILSTRSIPLRAINKSTGATIWSSPKIYGQSDSYNWVGMAGLSASSNNSIYFHDLFSDFAAAVDINTGLFKIAKRTNTGHAYGFPAISSAGKLFWLENQGYDASNNSAALVSANSDLSKNWGVTPILESNTKDLNYGFSAPVLSPDQSRVYFSYYGIVPTSLVKTTGEGALYAHNTSDGSLAWSYHTGPAADLLKVMVGSDGTIYAGASYGKLSAPPPPAYPTVYAINPDGTLKWSYTFSGTDYYMTLQSLGSDRIFGTVTNNSSYNKVFALSLTDGSVLWENNVNFYSNAYSESIADNSNGILIVHNLTYASTASTTIQKLDSGGNIKWGINYPLTGGVNFLGASSLIDEAGNLFVAQGSANSAYAGLSVFTNWTLSSTDISANNYQTGDTVSFEAISNMPQTNPLSGGANKVQIYFSNGDIAALTYSSTSGGDTHWTGTYTIPSYLASGTVTYTVEAAQDNISTDVTTHFAAPPENSSNTGLTATGTFQNTQIYGGGQWCQTDWSGGSGQLYYNNAATNKYYTAGGDGVIDSTANQLTKKVGANIAVGQPNLTSNTANNGGIGANTLSSPRGVYSDGTKLFTIERTNNRVLIFNTIPTSSSASADVVVGQPNMTSSTANNGGIGANTLAFSNSFANINGGVISVGTKLIIADQGNNRVLIYNTVPTSDGASADVVLGQSLFTTSTANNGGLSAQSLQRPATVFSDGTKLFVVDKVNNRVLIFNTIPTSNFTAADVVIGQAGLTTNGANQGGIGANTLSGPTNVYTDGTKLYVSDSSNQRVLIYNTVPTLSGASADVVVGQTDFISNSANQGGSVAANTLSSPQGIYSDGTKLYVSDSGNNRVLIYNTVPTSSNTSANAVIGQINFTSNSANQGGSVDAGTLSGAYGLYTNTDTLFVVDVSNNRILKYSLSDSHASTLTSSIYTGGSNYSTWGPLTYTGTTPTNTSFSFEISTNQGTSWQAVSNYINQTFGPSANVQYRATLANTDFLLTPTLTGVCVAYTTFNQQCTNCGGDPAPTPSPAPIITSSPSPTPSTSSGQATPTPTASSPQITLSPTPIIVPPSPPVTPSPTGTPLPLPTPLVAPSPGSTGSPQASLAPIFTLIVSPTPSIPPGSTGSPQVDKILDFIKKYGTILSSTLGILSLAVISLSPRIIVALNLFDLQPAIYKIYTNLLLLLPAYRRKKKEWGIVFDQESQTPIPNATVKLLSADDKRQLDKTVTDQDGRFLLLTDQLLLGRSANFILSPSKNGFVFNPPQALPIKEFQLYTGQTLTLKTAESNLIYAVPMQKEGAVHRHFSKLWLVAKGIIDKMAFPLASASLTLSALTFSLNQNRLNAFLLIFTSLIFMLQIYGMLNTKHSYGKVLDEGDAPLPFTQVRLYDLVRQSLVSATITNQKGSYIFLTKRGQYQISASLAGFKPYLSQIIPTDAEGVIKLAIRMSRQ
ncbi:MAG: NHL repeat containing protein [Parcubacteria group bacterium GW2011_GWA2_39_18]|nr:MAG: NHL repeat containing protein [Parcubacteria group bacterium GW2011_GWA2_39_18]